MAKGTKKAGSGPLIVLIAGAVALVGLFGYGVYQSNKTAEQNKEMASKLKPNENGCTSSPVNVKIEGLERVPCKSQQHATPPQRIKYDSDPPTSGTHYGTWVNAGFYAEEKQPEELVHSLEHGNVVIYYNPAKLAAADLDAIKALTKQFTGQWDGVVAVPRKDDKNPIILTAWESTLRLTSFDKARVDQFVDAFRGRGPENPVRPLSVK